MQGKSLYPEKRSNKVSSVVLSSTLSFPLELENNCCSSRFYELHF